MELLVSSATVFCLGIPNMHVSHISMYTELKTACYVVLSPFFWGGVGLGSAIYYWLLFQHITRHYFQFFFIVLS